ncbi:unnamed protein product [Closterium sp. NIES-64]|nr:unnamed protein product [Closterium sp. NIES-64]
MATANTFYFPPFANATPTRLENIDAARMSGPHNSAAPVGGGLPGHGGGLPRAHARALAEAAQRSAVLQGFPRVPAMFRRAFPFSHWGAEANAAITPRFFSWLWAHATWKKQRFPRLTRGNFAAEQRGRGRSGRRGEGGERGGGEWGKGKDGEVAVWCEDREV